MLRKQPGKRCGAKYAGDERAVEPHYQYPRLVPR